MFPCLSLSWKVQLTQHIVFLGESASFHEYIKSTENFVPIECHKINFKVKWVIMTD